MDATHTCTEVTIEEFERFEPDPDNLERGPDGKEVPARRRVRFPVYNAKLHSEDKDSPSVVRVTNSPSKFEEGKTYNVSITPAP